MRIERDVTRWALATQGPSHDSGSMEKMENVIWDIGGTKVGSMRVRRRENQASNYESSTIRGPHHSGGNNWGLSG